MNMSDSDCWRVKALTRSSTRLRRAAFQRRFSMSSWLITGLSITALGISRSSALIKSWAELGIPPVKIDTITSLFRQEDEQVTGADDTPGYVHANGPEHVARHRHTVMARPPSEGPPSQHCRPGSLGSRVADLIEKWRCGCWHLEGTGQCWVPGTEDEAGPEAIATQARVEHDAVWPIGSDGDVRQLEPSEPSHQPSQQAAVGRSAQQRGGAARCSRVRKINLDHSAVLH